MVRFRNLLLAGLIIFGTLVVTFVSMQSNRQVALAQRIEASRAIAASNAVLAAQASPSVVVIPAEGIDLQQFTQIMATASPRPVTIQVTPDKQQFIVSGETEDLEKANKIIESLRGKRAVAYAYGTQPGFLNQYTANQAQQPALVLAPNAVAPAIPNQAAQRWTAVTPYSPGGFVAAAVPSDPKTDELRQAYNNLETQVMQLAGEYRTSNDAQREELRNKIKDLTTKQFELKQQWRQLEIDRLKRQLESIEKGSQERVDKQDEVIERRVADLLQEENELRWEPLGGYGPPAYSPYSPAAQPVPVPPQNAGRTPNATQAQSRQVIEIRSLPDGSTVQVPRLVLEGGAGTLPGPALINPIVEATGGAANVPQAELQLKYAEERAKGLKTLFDRGQLSALEMQQAQQQLDLARLALTQSQQRVAALRDLMTLNLQQARVALEAAEAALREAEKSDQPDSKAKLQAVRDKATLDIRQAETLLKLLEESNSKPAAPSTSPADAAPQLILPPTTPRR